MSPNVGNFVHDLVEMAKAMERLPGVEADLNKAYGDIEAYATQVQRLEMKLIDRANEIETLHSKVREAEAGRDQAETMFLELDEKAHQIVGVLAMVQDMSRNAKDLIDPPKPQPEPVVEAKPEPVYQQGGFHPETDHDAAPVINWDVPLGQSEPSPTLPTAEPSATPPDATSPPAPASAATTTGQADAGVSVGSDPTHAAKHSSVGGVQSTMQDTVHIDQVTEAGPSDLLPTSAKPAATGTGTEPEASSSEPMKYDDTHNVRTEWWIWYDNLPNDVRSNLAWA